MLSQIQMIANDRVQHMAEAIVDREGGYNDVKGDKGGATNKGVSLRYARGKGLLLDLNKDSKVDEKDIKLVTREIAVNLYVDDFYFTPHIDELPECLRAQMFDIAVNAGAGRAVKLLQGVLLGMGCSVKADGEIGLITRRMAERCVAIYGPIKVNNALVDARKDFYHLLVQANPTQAKFEHGWEMRAESFRMR